MTPKQARDLLRVTVAADAETIRAAAASALFREHPDHGGTGEALTAIMEAKRCLLSLTDSDKNPCKLCGGRGSIRDRLCRQCNGTGEAIY